VSAQHRYVEFRRLRVTVYSVGPNIIWHCATAGTDICRYAGQGMVNLRLQQCRFIYRLQIRLLRFVWSDKEYIRW